MSDWRLGFNGENKNEFDFKSFFFFFFMFSTKCFGFDGCYEFSQAGSPWVKIKLPAITTYFSGFLRFSLVSFNG